MNLEELGIVLLNYNSFETTKHCLEGIKKYYDNKIRIVVVDNCSTDNSYIKLGEYLSGFSNIELILSESNGGYSKGNNTGLKFIEKNYPNVNYLAIINPDIEIIDNTIFQNLIGELENNPKLAGISPLMILDDTIKPERFAIKLPRYINNFLSSFAFLKPINPLIYRSYLVETETMMSYVDVLPGSFLLFKKEIFSEIGFFDEKVFLYGEELILAKKIKDKNLKLGLSFRNFYKHNHSDLKASFKTQFLHLIYSVKSHIYYNLNYNIIIWGLLDTILVLVFFPFRIMEIILFRVYYGSRKTNTK